MRTMLPKRILNLQTKSSLIKLILFFLAAFLISAYLPFNAQDPGKKVLEQNFNFDKQEEQKQDKGTFNGENIKAEEQIEPTIKTNDEIQKAPLLKGHISKVPGGTKLKIILETPIDELTSMVDDEITARTAENIEIDGKVVIPAGSTVVGKISETSLAKRLHKAGTVRVEFKNLTMPDGRQVPILASVLTHSGLIKGKYNKKRALIAGATFLGPAAAGFGAGLAAEGSLVGAGIGALVGTLAGVGLFTFQKEIWLI